MNWEKVCNILERMGSSVPAPRRRKLLCSLLADARACGDPYSVMRILLPKRDRLRPQYRLKEEGLAKCLMDALALAPSSEDGIRLRFWRTEAGSESGDLSSVAFQVISERQQQQHEPGALTIDNLHCHLDKLSASPTREGKTSVLRDLIKQTTAQQMKWIVRLILQDMRIGVGEKTVLKEFHPDADALMSMCVDLHDVSVQLASLSVRWRHQDLVVGKALKCQHSKRVNTIDAAWDLMKGKRMVAECKFDGDRMQLHKDGDTLYFWSRNGLEHAEYNVAIGSMLQQHINSKRCVLDGELLVWNCTEERYKPRTRTLNWDAARAARKDWDTDELICYVVFDILYEEDHGSLLHLPLTYRQELLKKFIRQCHPRLMLILPDDGGSKWSIRPKGREDLVQFFTEVVQRGDEGIIVKDLESQWSPDNRDGRWCKIKPDYLSLGSDLDLLIIGGYYGKNQRGSQIVSYLLAVKDQSKPDVIPSGFLTICRCGGGLSDTEQALLQRRLAPHIMKNTKSGMLPLDSGYMVTNNWFERPDVWISSPRHSVVLQVSAEKRIYASNTFKVGWTFRFPRAEKVRYDKVWHDCLSIQDFEEMLVAAKAHGSSLIGKYNPLPFNDKMKQKQRKRSRSQRDIVPAFLQGCDVTYIVQQNSYFQNLIFYICNSGEKEMTQALHAQIKQGGGNTVLNLDNYVTHVISAQPRGMHYRTAVTSGRDVISLAWLQECLSSAKLLHVNFRYYLHMSDVTKEKQKDYVDAFGDSYVDTVTPEDLGKVFSKMRDLPMQSVLQDTIAEMESRFSRSWEWGIFRRMTIFPLCPLYSMNKDSQAVAQLALRRLTLEVSIRGGIVTDAMSNSVTHVIVFSPIDMKLSSTSMLRSIQGSEQRDILQHKDVNIVSHLWLEESLQQKLTLPVAAYSLREAIVVEASGKILQDRVLSPESKAQDSNQDDIMVLHPRSKRLQLCHPSSPTRQDSVDEILKILLPNFCD